MSSSQDQESLTVDPAAERDAMSNPERLVIRVLNTLLRATLDTVDAVLEGVLDHIGTHCHFDRVYVFRLSPDGAFIDNTDEWLAPGIAPMRQMFQHHPVGQAPLWQRMLQQDGALLFPVVADLPETDPGRAILDSGDIRSALLVPLREGGRIVGMLGFDKVRGLRRITSNELFVFEAVASGIAALLQRTGMEREALRARGELEESRNRLQATLAAMPDLVLEMDGDGRFTACHTSAPEKMVAPPELVIGRTVAEVLPPEVVAVVQAAMREVDATGRSEGLRYRLELPTGPAWFELSAARRAPALRETRHGYVVVVRDVSEPATVLEQLQYRDTLMSGLFELSPVGMVLSDHETRAILDANAAFLAMAGYDKATLLQRSYGDLLTNSGIDARAILRETGRYGPFSEEYVRADGSRFPIISRGFLVEDPSGRKLLWSVIEDTTTLKAQQNAVEARSREARAAQSQLETALEALNDGFALFDAEDRLVLCNKRYRDLIPDADPTWPEARPTYTEIIDHCIARGHYRYAIGNEAAYRAELLARHRSDHHETYVAFADGRIIRMVEQATPDGGRVGLRIDVTEKQRSEQYLSDVIEGAQVGTWEWDVPSNSNRINDRWAEMLGYTKAAIEPIIASGWQRLIHPEDAVAAAAKLEQVLRRDEDQFEYVLRMRHLDGHWVWVQSRGRVVRWMPDGTAALMAGVHLDISALKEAEAQMDSIIDGTGVGTWSFDVTQADTRVSARWAEMIGYTEDEINPLSRELWEELIHPDDLIALIAAEEDHFSRGEWLVEVEVRLRHKAGHWVWVLTRGRAIGWDEAGKPTRIAGVNIDISARKELEFALQRERDFLARLMETSASGIVAMDEVGRIIFANKEAETVLGRPLGQIEGTSYDASDWQIGDIEGNPISREVLPFAQVTASRQTLRDYRMSVATRDGTRRLLSVNAAPLSAPGVAATVVCSVTDITAAVEAEATLRAAMERAEAGSRAKSEFLANMSHEIRTPLNGVLGMAEVLGETLHEPEQKAMVATIRQSGELLLAVINDILDLAKIESGRMTLERRAFSPADLAQRIEALHGLSARGKGIELTLLSDPGAGLKRMGDAQRVLQILHNLVGNAVKFTESGEVRLVISARADNPVVIEVSDTGIGMTPEQISRVFDPFTQADGTITRRFGGTGLGLPIVRQLVTLMEGTISINAEPGKGTRVRVSLPLDLADSAASGRTMPPMPLASVAQVRALVAEDNATNRFILRSMLSNLGVSFTMVNDGAEAVSTWQPGLFDVLLLDISMPHKDGLTALDEINAKALRLGAKVPPALAVTANAMTHHVAQYSAAGFAACVSKPVRMDQLAASIAEACRAA